MKKLSPCIWFNNNVEEASKLYKSVFKKFKIINRANYDDAFAEAGGQGMPKGTLLEMTVSIEGLKVMLLNGGPIFKPNPSVSYFITCKTAKEVDATYNKLVQGGKVMMALDKYPFSPRYAWIEDKFGVSWQIMLGKAKQKVRPCLLFVGKQNGRAQEAMKLYSSVFKGSKIISVEKYQKGEPNTTGYIKYGAFNLQGKDMVAMDGGKAHQFAFNEGNSFIIWVKDQKELDYYWKKLTANGGQESQCGWLKDKFGVSWQVVPEVLEKLMVSKDKDKVSNMNRALYKMKKLDLKVLLDAYHGKDLDNKKGGKRK